MTTDTETNLPADLLACALVFAIAALLAYGTGYPVVGAICAVALVLSLLVAGIGLVVRR